MTSNNTGNSKSKIFSYTHMNADLSESFGLELALKKTKMTEPELEKLVGRYTKGAKKGKLRGTLSWSRVEAQGQTSFADSWGSLDVLLPVGTCFAYGICVFKEWKKPPEYVWGVPRTNTKKWMMDLRKKNKPYKPMKLWGTPKD